MILLTLEAGGQNEASMGIMPAEGGETSSSRERAFTAMTLPFSRDQVWPGYSWNWPGLGWRTVATHRVMWSLTALLCKMSAHVSTSTP